jgi:hypothetical protein
MRRSFVLLLFLGLLGCASPPRAVFTLDLGWLRGCWIGSDRQSTMRWLPPRAGGAVLLGDYQDISDTSGGERWILEQRPQGLILVRPITTPGGPVETFALVGAAPNEAVFAGAAGVQVRLTGGQDRLAMRLETPADGAVLFEGDRDGCD